MSFARTEEGGKANQVGTEVKGSARSRERLFLPELDRRDVLVAVVIALRERVRLERGGEWSRSPGTRKALQRFPWSRDL